MKPKIPKGITPMSKKVHDAMDTKYELWKRIEKMSVEQLLALAESFSRTATRVMILAAQRMQEGTHQSPPPQAPVKIKLPRRQRWRLN